MFAVNQDAHSIEDIFNIRFGIAIARKGGIKKNEVLNCMKVDEFIKYLKKKR